MRIGSVGVASSFFALVGFASTANAIATIELLWNGVDSNATIATSSSITLQMIYTNDQHSVVAIVSVDYSDANGKYSLVAFTSNPNRATTPFLPLPNGITLDDGSAVRNFQAAALPPYLGVGLPPGQSFLLGTLTFHKDGPGSGSFIIQSFLGFDDFIGGGGQTICNQADSSNCTLGSATLNNVVPEPGTVSLLALGLAGLALAAHRKDWR